MGHSPPVLWGGIRGSFLAEDTAPPYYMFVRKTVSHTVLLPGASPRGILDELVNITRIICRATYYR